MVEEVDVGLRPLGGIVPEILRVVEGGEVDERIGVTLEQDIELVAGLG